MPNYDQNRNTQTRSRIQAKSRIRARIALSIVRKRNYLRRTVITIQRPQFQPVIAYEMRELSKIV